MGTADVTLYAKWITGAVYTVTYNANNADSGTIPVDNVYYATGNIAPVLPNSGNLVRAGYSFIGWNTKSNGTGTDYEPCSTYTIGIANVVLYAKWSFPIMIDEDFDDGAFDSTMFASNGTSITGGVLAVDQSGSAGIRSRLFKIPVIVEGRANIQDSSATGIVEYFCIRQNPDTYSSLNPIFHFGFASGFDYSYIAAEISYWDSPVTTADDSAATIFNEAEYHVFRMEIHNDIQYFYIDNVLVRTTYYSFLSNTWWNFIMRGDAANTGSQELDWIKIYTARPGDTDPLWP